MITRDELIEACRMAGTRAAAAATYCADWDRQLGHQWTSGDAFRHIAAGAANGISPAAAGQFMEALESGSLPNNIPAEQAAAANERGKGKIQDWSREQIIAAIKDLGEARAQYLEGVDDARLERTVRLGGYEMPLGEILAQIWVHHTVAHAYEASARWP